MGRHIPRNLARAAAIVTVLMLLSPAAQAIEIEIRDSSNAGPAQTSTAEVSTNALYNGKLVDLSGDWEGARACIVIPEYLALAECFDTDGERDERLADLGLSYLFEETKIPAGLRPHTSYCSSYLKLYNGYSYSGQSLWLSARGFWLNLSQYSFNQKTSSYKVGGCSTYMADWASGGGTWIPTSATQAWDKDSVISGSMNNDVSSVYIT